MSKFLKGTMVLMAAGFITRLLGFVNRIVLARMVGAEGVGLYMMSFPTLTLVITLTQMGLPVAISKSVAEAEAQGDKRKVKKILVVSLTVTGTLSILFTPALFFVAPYLSQAFFTDQRTIYPLLAITPIIPIVAISSVIRGYFQGKQNMKPAAISQVIEQIVRIALIIFFASKFLPLGIEYAAAAAMGAAVIGELASLIYLYFTFKLRKKFKVRRQFFKSAKGGKQTLKELMRVALPTTGGRLIGSLSWFFEPIVVAQSLLLAGIVAEVATKQYGLLTGFAMPLLTLPSFATFSLSTALVPAISEANANRNSSLVEYRLQQAIRFAMLLGGLSVVVIYVFAEPLMLLLYGSADGFDLIKLMAPFFIFYYIQGPLQAILQALDLAKAAMINSLIGAVIKIAVIFIFASQPQFGIHGVALAIAVATVLVSLLHFATVLKKIQFTIYVRQYFKMFIVMIIAAMVGMTYFKYYFINHFSLTTLLLGILLTCCVYMIFSLLFKVLKRSDLLYIPGLNRIIK